MKNSSLHTCIDTFAFAFLLLSLLGLLYGESTRSIGFLSDDWSLIHRAASAPFWIPAEQHHYSIVINLLFKGVALGVLNASSIHLLAFVFHALNAFVIYFFVRDLLKCKPLEAKVIATFFALSPTGLEAITWCCAIGYVLCAFWILLALYAFWSAGSSALRLSKACLIAILQLGAFLCWDWGLVLAPSLAVQCYMSLGLFSKKSSFSSRLYALWPVLLIWIALVIFKRSIGQDFGYGVNSPWQMLSNLISVPLLGVLPQFTKSFYISYGGKVLAVCFFSTLAWTAWRNAAAKAMLMLLMVWQLPLVLLGYPQSRYFYLLVFPLYFIYMQFAKELVFLFNISKAENLLKVMGFILALTLLCTYFVWSSERVAWWKTASEESQSIYRQIEAVAKRELKPLAIINMPDRHGPADMIWLPYLWRCGLVHFQKTFYQMYTSDCRHSPNDSIASTFTREVIAERYSQYALYEVQQTPDRQTLLLRKLAL